MSTFFHRQIEFDVLRKTPKAVLIKVNKVKSTKYNKVYKKFKKFLDPVEMWVPRSWLKKDRHVTWVGVPGNMESYTYRFWVWEEGFLKNLKKLYEKREANYDA
jgi:hypothetical protein